MQVGLNWARDEDEALQGAFDQWRYNAQGGEVNWELRSPGDFETATRFVRAEDMRESVFISADLGQHAAWLQTIWSWDSRSFTCIRSAPINGSSSTRLAKAFCLR
jgi:hypothetical protein